MSTQTYGTPTGTPPAGRGGGGAGKVGLIAGILFVILFLVGFMLYSTPESDVADQEWFDWFADKDNRTKASIASILTMLAGVSWLWFAGAVRRRLVNVVPGADASFAGGVAYGVLVLLAGFGAGAIALANQIADVPIPKDADLLRYADGGYYGIVFLPLPYAAAAFLIPLFFAARGTDLFPSWLGIFGLVVGIVCLTGPFLFFVPHLLFLIWVLVASVVLLMRDGAGSTTT